MKIIKKDQKKFFDHMSKFFIANGAKRIESNIENKNSFEVNTLYGLLTVNIYNECSLLFSILSKFNDVDRAKACTNCNPYSGKYNFHSQSSLENATLEAEQFFNLVFPSDEIKDIANHLADYISIKINNSEFKEQYGRQACLEEIIKILESRV